MFRLSFITIEATSTRIFMVTVLITNFTIYSARSKHIRVDFSFSIFIAARSFQQPNLPHTSIYKFYRYIHSLCNLFRRHSAGQEALAYDLHILSDFDNMLIRISIIGWIYSISHSFSLSANLSKSSSSK